MPYQALLSLWARPRETYRAIIQHRPGNSSVGLYVLAFYLTLAQHLLSSHHSSLAVTLLVLVAPLVATTLLYLQGWMLRLVCGWFDGQAQALGIRTALAWGGVPATLGILLWLLGYLLYGDAMLWEESGQLPKQGGVLVVSLVGLVLTCYSVITTCQMLAEANGFSAWRALASVLLTLMLATMLALAVAIPLILLVLGPDILALQ
ncbi:YIP1 family protein [Gallaecimonas kandeliae]|uniref:YIP1 family protein n=1 Tax=Gallaecimonas kandeliae TaxID=3029055 RepID=UPI00264866C6|nr:YIP1 family protein [Gallaecimonas kandeliae]WKE66944.1 YIP1 family protein [Gallaecimonas kandeliae]